MWLDVADSNPRLAGKLTLTEDFEPLPFDEAIAFFRNKVNLSPSEFNALNAAAQAKAFTVAAGATEQIRQNIFTLIDRAQSDGLTLREFQRMAAEVLEAAGVAPRAPWYWETVYRTNLQTSYQAGRWQQATHPDVVAARPFLRYVSARLPTSRPSHVEKHGRIFRHDHPFWDEWLPPNGFNCFCTVHTVSERELSRNGWVVSDDLDFSFPDPDGGFAVNVGKTEEI